MGIWLVNPHPPKEGEMLLPLHASNRKLCEQFAKRARPHKVLQLLFHIVWKLKGKKNRHGLAESALFEMELEDLKRKEYGLYINIINQCFFVHQSLETTWAINSYKSYCDPVLHKFIDLAKKFFVFFSKISHHWFPWSSKASYKDYSTPKDARGINILNNPGMLK